MPKTPRLISAAALFMAVFNLFAASNSPSRFTVDQWGSDIRFPQNFQLPQRSVFAIAQTRDGYLWLGTGGGLARFDGIHFKTFDGSNTPELDNTKVVKLFEDSRGELWIGTDAGAVMVADKTGSLKQVQLGKPGGDGPLVSFCEDQSGGIWLRMASGRLYRYQDGKATIIMSNCHGLVTENSGLVWVGTMDRRLIALGPVSPSASRAMPVSYDLPAGWLDYALTSRQGGYWRLVNGRVQRCKRDKVERDFGPYPWKETSTPVIAACEDSTGNLIVGTYGDGIYWLGNDGQFSHLPQDQGLTNSYIFSLCIDHEGSLWVGTDGDGLFRVKPKMFEVLDKSIGKSIQSVCQDNDGTLWLGINNGGVNSWKNGVLKEYGAREGLSDLYVRTVFADKEQRMWAGTANGGLFQLRNGMFQSVSMPGYENQAVSVIFQDSHGTLWVGTRGGLASLDEHGWKFLTVQDGLSANSILAIAEDSRGNLWLGTEDAGVDCLANGKITSHSKPSGLPSPHILSLYADSDGVVWVGTSSGLARLEGDKCKTFPGLINNRVGYLVEDDKGYLWMGSTAGLMRAEKKALNAYTTGAAEMVPIRSYGQADGLPASECTFAVQPGACPTRDGKLWFPTIRGLASVNPGLLSPNSNAPPVIIESVRIDGQLQNPDRLRAAAPRSVEVRAGKQSIEIDYTSLNLTAPYKGRFKYRLENHESAWNEVPGDWRSARYSKLPPAHYRFQVIACNEDGVWNMTGSTLDVNILPPFWRTSWFLSLATLLLLGAIIGSVHFVSTQKLHRQLENLRQHEAVEHERSRIARDLHDQLGANLTQVALLGELAETDKNLPDEVEAHARQISLTARETTNSLDEIVWTVNPSNDTLEGLVNYICKYAQDYLATAGLRYRLDVPPQLPATPISPELRHNVFLAAKESINNVVKHAKASSARLRLELAPTLFTLEIEDNGSGLSPEAEKKGRNGLKNMRKRMDDVGGTFDVGPGAEGGTRVRLTAPLQKSSSST